MHNNIFKRILTFVLASALIVSMVRGSQFDLTASAATGTTFERVADHESIDYWKGYFSDGQYDSNVWSNTISTQNAGAVWTDKSVFVPNESITIDGVEVPVADTGDNFLVSMSVMASNKTVKGYEYIPTSTMLVLDVSASMGDGSNGNNSWDEMVEAANKAMDTLLNLNNNNLVGVVLYSGNTAEANSNLGHSTLLLPLDRYTTTATNNNGTNNTNDDYPEYLTASTERGTSKVGVNSAVRPRTSGSKNVSGGTYIQGGLYHAMEELIADDAPKTVTEGVQAGMAYTPIVVLMSDGAPTAANLDYDFSETNDNNHDTEIGNGTSTDERIGFLTQLTAAYAKARIDAAYEKDMLFYTLGLGLDELNDTQEVIAEAVLSPDKNNSKMNNYWNDYLALDNDPSTRVSDTMYLNPNNYGGGTNAVVKNDYVTSDHKNYVTQYFEAVASTGVTLERALLDAFQQIVDAIVIQSVYYPTEIAGGNADLGGYVTFRDELGEYMDVVNVKGFLFEDEKGNQVLHTGSKLARNFVTGGGDLGQSSNPKPLGDELVRAVKERLGIANTLTAQNLIRNAYNYGQLSYENENNFSNYIGWYGDIDGKFVDFWHDGHTQAEEQAAMAKGAKFIYKSYGYLGEVNEDLGIKASDMMYTTIRVRKTIAENVEGTSVGEIIVEGAIPASLIPTITYEIELKGKTYESGIQSVKVTGTSAKYPARILYEVALRPDINPNNIADKVSAAHKNQDGTYTFYTNAWSEVDYENNVIADTSENTFTFFEPARENERYYYLTDSVVYRDDKGTVYTGNTKPEGDGYYHSYRVFTVENGVPASKIIYIKSSPEALEYAKKVDGQWVIPGGTGKHEIVGYEVPVKNINYTGTNAFTAYPKIKSDTDKFYETHAAHYAVVTFGNNGRLRVNVEPIKKVYDEDPAQSPDAENIDGNAVMVGDVLTYTIDVINYEDVAADITVTDTIPAGTAYVSGSASNNGSYDSTAGKLTWTLKEVEAGSKVVLSFKVQVTEAALSNTVNSINNTANITVDIGENSYSFNSNTTTNQTEGKKVVNTEGQPAGTVKLGDVLVYSIQFVNDEDTAATVTITDKVPTGTAFVSADHNGSYNANTKTVTWKFTDVQPGFSGVVTFRAVVTAEAASLSDAAGAADETDDTIVNYATITVGENDPDVRMTNETTNELTHGDLVLTKAVTGTNHTEGDVFNLILTDLGASTGNIAALTGKYAYTVYEKDTTQNVWKVVDTNASNFADFGADSTTGKTAGVAYVAIEEGQYVVVEDLPTGLVLDVSEDTANMPAGYTLKSIQNSNVTIGTTQVTSGNIAEVIANSNYTKTVVNNTYSTVPASVTLVTTKALANKALVGGEFSFVLKDSSGATKQMVSNDAAGNVKFAAMTFDTVGSYTYTVTEVKGNDVNIDYSTKSYTVTIKVSDNNEGALVAEVDGAVATSVAGVYQLGTDTEGGFDNTYTPDPVSLRLSGTKALTGAAADGLRLDEFSFVLKEGNSTIATAGNAADTDADANGNYEAAFAFPTMYYYLSDLNGATSKTFTYTVSEYIPATDSIYYDPNMKYDTTVYTVKVTLSYDSASGLLSLSQPVIEDGEALSFTNIQNPDSVSVPLRAGKATANVLDGDASRFSFVITDVTDPNNPKEVIYGSAPAVSAGDAAVAGNVTFPELTYTAADLGDATSKTFNYTMKEVGTANGNGITYDTTKYDFSVTLSRDTNGALQAVRSYADTDAPVFHNVYEAKGSLTIHTKKRLDVPQGSDRTLKAGEFRFKLERSDNPGVVHYGTNDVAGNVVFDTLYYTQADAGNTYTYIMTEQPGNISGVTYDATEYKIAVAITDNGDGSVKAEVTSVKKVVDEQETEINTIPEYAFVNTYSVTQGTNAAITAKKVLNGRTLQAGEFKFNLYYLGKETVTRNVLISSAVNDKTGDNTGNVSFALEYPATTPVGNYIYRIEEEAPVLTVGAETNGITYAKNVYFAKVTITDNNSQLGSSVSYYKDAECTQLVQDIDVVFTNQYTTEKVIWTPVGLYKQLTGRDMAAGEFTFELKDITDANSTLKLTGTNNAAENGQYGAIVFDAITFEDWNTAVAGDTKTFKYQISEVVDEGKLPVGVAAETSVLYMTVTVKDTGMGTLSIEAVNYFSDAECNSRISGTAALTNTYDAKPTSTVLSGTKMLDNKKLVSGEFEFKLVGHGLELTSTNDANGLFSFQIPETVLKEAGNYTFTVSESNVKTAVAGQYTGQYTYDSAYVTATVNVADDGKGQLYVAETTYVEHFEGNGVPVSGIAFLNTYKPAPITKDIDASIENGGLNVDVDKLVDTSTSGVSYDLAGFKFEVRDLNNTVVSTGTSDEFGNVNFDKLLTFREAGQYRFRISEVDANGDADATNDKANMTFSDDVWELHVLVRYDEVNGVLYIGNNDVAAYQFQAGKTTATTEPTLDIDYVNVYEPDSVTVDLNMSKILQSANGTSRELQKYEFIFQIVDANNKLVAETANVGNDVKFALTFDKVGTYNYKVKEVIGTSGGVTYDNSVYDFEVIVSDATLDGKLEAAVTIKDKNQDIVQDIIFKNSYAATPAKVVITAQKTLENRPLAADEFTFELVGENGDVYTAQNDVAGKVTFEELSFNAVGTYKYTLTEKKGTLANVTYSEEAYNVTIEVKDNLLGQMIAEVAYAAVDGDGNESVVSEATFTNIYTPDPSAVIIDATKELTGRDLVAGEFQFVVKDETGKELATGTNTAEGKIYFEEFKLPEGNDYKLYVSEVDTAAEHVLYDGTTYTVLVDVTNDGSGILKVTVEYPDGGIVFRNEYKEPPVIVPDPETIMTSFAFNATKVLTGRIMAAGEFQFQVKDSNGEVVATGINEANGNVQLSPLVVFEPGRYVYTVSEVNTGVLGITYDTTVHTVIVDVERVGDDLAATINYPEGGLTFRNYVGRTNPLTGDSTPIGLLIALVLISGAGVAGLLILKRKKK